MRIKRRKYGIGARLTFRDIEKSAKRRLGKNPNEGKVTLGHCIICGSTIFLMKFDFLPESVPCRELLTVVIAVAFMGLGLYLECRRLAPRTRWRNAIWATGMIASAWSLIPWILYFIGEAENRDVVLQIFIASIAMWLVCLGCVLRHRYIRRRSQQEIAMMRMRERRRKLNAY